ncbi:hypothetical protein CONLIGDRAFT_576487 [Coniochaeta ligniaria NRRL 30616]|uniref:JmjC domain-containing protein n=1 Tax=Coniochaeta ligniaria NRRL 30616 TaxID=1408157 RepID=A0A1J7JJN8_9PEZI|nr:hypothetical protein CONLIGDRAFT_576487 [Coniochaeta ligniaria NRRL 30616]
MAHPSVPGLDDAEPSRPTAMRPSNEPDDDAIVLAPEQASQVDRFREELRLCEADTQRYDLCVQKRDELLNRHTGLQILVAGCEHVMSSECPEYRRRKQTTNRDSTQPPPANQEDDAAQWNRFFGVAIDGSKRLSALKEVVRCWGRDVVQHYQWASKGEKYWNQLRTTARRVPVWEEAVVGLNWSMLQRSRDIRRRPVKALANPIEQADLDSLRTWSREDPFPCQKLAAKDLPEAFGFDKYGLIVHKEFAVDLPEPDGSRATLSFPLATLSLTSPASRDPDVGHCLRPKSDPDGSQDIMSAATSFSADRPIRRRAASLPDITQPVSKRPRLDAPPPFLPTPMVRPDVAGDRPMHDRMVDDTYRRRVRAELRGKSSQHTSSQDSHGKKTDELIYKLLEKAEQPNTDSNRGVIEALLCTGDEAASLAESGSPHDAPIITEGQQQFQWSKGDRPIVQFFRRMGFLDKSVSVQIPSRSCTSQSYEVRKLGEVRKHFLTQDSTDDPWNIFDLQSPLPQSMPNFLMGENCQLLLQVRNAVLMEESAERVVASTQQWNEWKNVLDWVLLSEGGHNTVPHMDSHGFATCITVQEGSIGFGWMSCPTEEERNSWMADPRCYTGGRWRYIVLKPGQSVFFMPGTIHFVLRVRERQTLALGGHILQWSDIRRWMKVVLAQTRNPAITNEDMKRSAPKYVRAVAKLVKARVEEGEVEQLGGEAAVTQFFASVKVRLARTF